MILHRFVIGIKFNKRCFKLPSVGGIAIDEIIALCEKDKELGPNYYNQVSTPATRDAEYTVSLMKDKGVNTLSILPDQLVFKKSQESSGSLNVDKVISEFQKIWKVANRVCAFPDVRRIGFVGEYRIIPAKNSKSADLLISNLTKFSPPYDCNKFHLTWEDRGLSSLGNVANPEVDAFINKIYSFYMSEMDETPEKGQINANIDVQKYFNPAKLDPLGELREIKDIYLKSKIEFKNKVKEMGLDN